MCGSAAHDCRLIDRKPLKPGKANGEVMIGASVTIVFYELIPSLPQGPPNSLSVSECMAMGNSVYALTVPVS